MGDESLIKYRSGHRPFAHPAEPFRRKPKHRLRAIVAPRSPVEKLDPRRKVADNNRTSRHRDSSSQESNSSLLEAARGALASLADLLKSSRLPWAEDRHMHTPGKLEEAGLLGDATQRAIEVNEQEQRSKENADIKAPPPDILHFLYKVGIMEIRYIRMLASLCSLTYHLSGMTERSLFRRHGLKLVTTSLLYERVLKETPKTVSQVYEEGDGMAVSPNAMVGRYEELLKCGENKVPAMQALEKLKEAEPRNKMPSPAEIVGTRLSMAAAAAAAIANAAASAAASAAVPLASNISSAAVGATAAPMQVLGSQLQWASSIGQSTAVATVATVTAALESTWSKKPVTKRQAISSSYWFVADDPRAHTRFFAIQGSNNIDHWRINLQFDPVHFEDPSLGLKVHRGFYEAAEILYEQFLPLVEEHLRLSPFAKIVFTGHSLGGSLSTLLMMMFLHRKKIPPHALGPVYTFGAPSIFCETTPVQPQAKNQEEGKSSSRPPTPPSTPISTNGEAVLERMGLNGGAIRNVMMHRDLVPRAFACDYTLVADLLARVSDSFRNLESLHGPHRKQMYYALGRTLVLQPDVAQRFVYGNTDHPMLPPGPNLFTIRDPQTLANATEKLQSKLNNVTSAAGLGKQVSSSRKLQRARIAASQANGSQTEPRRGGAANTTALGSNIDDNAPDRTGGANLGPPARTVADATAALMDTPHPLDILGEPGSYGFTGAISRYHDPEHYCKALGGVLKARARPWREDASPAAKSLTPSSDLPRLHHIEAPLRRSRKYRNREYISSSLSDENQALG